MAAAGAGVVGPGEEGAAIPEEGAGCVVATAEAGGGASGAVVAGMVVVGGDDDMIEQELSDTKVVGARVLPCRGRRL